MADRTAAEHVAGGPPVLAVVGPTAAGKSDLAVELALAVGGEVINADSMQLYRGMDVGTAKLAVAERRGVPHHLLDIWSVRETANVADYQQRARAVVDDLRARGQIPILVGGSGLYVRAVLDQLDFPGTEPALRSQLEVELAAVGSGEMHRRLTEVDPAAAAAILPSNGRRIVRALEVIALTGAPFAASLPDLRPVYDAVVVGIAVPLAELDQRIETRVDQMWERGLVAEVRALEEEGLREGITASRALGYAQVLDLLAGRLTDREARDKTVTATRKFARRQLSWFRRDTRTEWLEGGRSDMVTTALALLRQRWSNGPVG